MFMHASDFEQVWAADDYEIFKRMMIQKNIELQLQALELIQQKWPHLTSFVASKTCLLVTYLNQYILQHRGSRIAQPLL